MLRLENYLALAHQWFSIYFYSPNICTIGMAT